MSLVPMKYGMIWVTYTTTALVSVYTGDGTVSIVHGGVEIGQGINTKVCSYRKEVATSAIHVLETKSVL